VLGLDAIGRALSCGFAVYPCIGDGVSARQHGRSSKSHVDTVVNHTGVAPVRCIHGCVRGSDSSRRRGDLRIPQSAGPIRSPHYGSSRARGKTYRRGDQGFSGLPWRCRRTTWLRLTATGHTTYRRHLQALQSIAGLRVHRASTRE
jgi:hypothetical protein